MAEDGKTAKGVWMSPGHEARVLGGKLTAMWVWGTYGEDFIKEDGRLEDPQPPRLPEHHHAVRRALDGRPSVTGRRHLPAGPARRVQAGPSQHLPLDVLPGFVVELVPAPPEPHDTYDPSTDYIK